MTSESTSAVKTEENPNVPKVTTVATSVSAVFSTRGINTFSDSLSLNLSLSVRIPSLSDKWRTLFLSLCKWGFTFNNGKRRGCCEKNDGQAFLGGKEKRNGGK
ncbi:hypothetical protein ACOSP7_013637 [Xanthoceras sorbifolium]